MPSGLEPYLDFSVWPDVEHVVRVVAAVILGGIVGLEREIRDKPAGFRTIMLICVGACIFTIISEAAGRGDWQRTRIAAQIVTGVGFLGAGAILRDRGSVVGLTTASTIWAVAAIGMAVGFGYLALGLLGTVVILVALLLFEVFETWIGRLRDIQDFHILTANTDDAIERVIALFKEAKLTVRKRYSHEEGDSVLVHVVAVGRKRRHERLRMKILRSSDFTLRRA